MSASGAAAATICSAVDATARAPSRATARRHSAAMSRAPSRQRGPVSTRMAADPAAGSATRRSIATRSATSGIDSSPASPTTSTGTPRARQRLGHRRGVGITPNQHRGGGRRAARGGGLGVAGGDVLGHPVPFGGDVGQQRACDGARLGAGPGPQGTHRHRAPAGLGGHRVGDVQRARRVAPTGAQFEGRCRGPVGLREVGGEAGQVGRRGAAPAVDGLDRVAHRGERQTVVGPAAEQRRQRDALGVPGVLVFVEQHDPVAVAQLVADLRAARGQPRGRRHLRTEVHHLLGGHPGVDGVDQRHQRGCVRSGWPAC